MPIHPKPLKSYEVFYTADPLNVHATIKALNGANARHAVQRMMEDGEAYGMDLSYRATKRCTCSERQLEQVGCDCDASN